MYMDGSCLRTWNLTTTKVTLKQFRGTCNKSRSLHTKLLKVFWYFNVFQSIQTSLELKLDSGDIMIKTHSSNLVELDAVVRVNVSDETARPNGAIDRALSVTNVGVRLEVESVGIIVASSGVAPTKELEDMFRLILDEPGRETVGDELFS